jgi:hypothetical protein
MNEKEKTPPRVVYRQREDRQEEESVGVHRTSLFSQGDKAEFSLRLFSWPFDGRLTLQTPPEGKPNESSSAKDNPSRTIERNRER